MLSPSAISPERCPDTFPKRQPQRCILDPHSDPAKLSPRFQFLLPPRSPPLTLWLTIAPQFFLVLTPSKLTSFQLSPTTPALRGFSPLLCSPKLLPTNRRSNWSLIKALSGVSRGFGPAGISRLLHREGTRLAVSSSWEGSAPQLRECKQVFLAWTAMF